VALTLLEAWPLHWLTMELITLKREIIFRIVKHKNCTKTALLIKWLKKTLFDQKTKKFMPGAAHRKSSSYECSCFFVFIPMNIKEIERQLNDLLFEGCSTCNVDLESPQREV
jgi:hypothetical protein